ncbi:protein DETOXIFICATION 45, chloroplastic-like [Daucus carota subsp. sativus]|uniref:protein DETOXIFICATION 45, chloroplastic-like n=1 Tax=Daucus carota subsp. sativus TaxID=79200 RepID=UPI0030832743
MDENLSIEEEFEPSTSEDTFLDLNENSTSVASDKIKAELRGNATNPTHELITLSLPAILGQAIDPFAQLMETAFIGRLGPVELASAGVSISIFNIVSKLFNIPLLSVATSFVAEDISRNAHSRSNSGTLSCSSNGLHYCFQASQQARRRSQPDHCAQAN